MGLQLEIACSNTQKTCYGVPGLHRSPGGMILIADRFHTDWISKRVETLPCGLRSFLCNTSLC